MNLAKLVPSEMDVAHLDIIRESVVNFIASVAKQYSRPGARLLDIAPQDHEGARPFFPLDVTVETFDVDPTSGCTYIGDICATNEALAAATFDYVVCTEVLEHTLNPFAAVAEIHRILKPGGMLFASTPFNFRIHGPLPDCWRFTRHGLQALLKDFDLVALDEVETPGRPLAPIHYTVVAQRPR